MRVRLCSQLIFLTLLPEHITNKPECTDPVYAASMKHAPPAARSDGTAYLERCSNLRSQEHPQEACTDCAASRRGLAVLPGGGGRNDDAGLDALRAVRARDPAAFNQGLLDVETSDLPSFQAAARYFRHDYEAIQAAPSTP